MNKVNFTLIGVIFMLIFNNITYSKSKASGDYKYSPFNPPISYEEATKRAEQILSKMSLDDKIQLLGGHKLFYVKGFKKYGIPEFYMSDATQGVHIRKIVSKKLRKSVAFPSPICLSSTWNPELAYKYAKSIGEECRAGGIAVLLGPGMNIYRISQNGRNFEYFGEDPYLAARMIENYVVGVQSTGTIATLKHFVCNNNEYHRRTTNVIVDERSLFEIYTYPFKAGIDAGAMAVMTAYNKVNGEWCGQSKFVVDCLLRKKLGFKWLVMSDWWSTWNPEKTIKSGIDLEMPGDILDGHPVFDRIGDITVKSNTKRLLKEGKITENDINRMAKNIIRTFIAMGLYDRPVMEKKFLKNFPIHEKIALQTAREGIVLLKNKNNILPINSSKKILLTGKFVRKIPHGEGSAYVKGYNRISLIKALKSEFGRKIKYKRNPSDKHIINSDVVILCIGTIDSEGKDRPFELPEEIEKNIKRIVSLNPNTVVIVNSGGGIKMTDWADKVGAIIYAWYPGQIGNIALAEILAGKVNPSGKLPITIEKDFKDSPGYGYIPEGTDLNTGWGEDFNIFFEVNNIEYKEGILVGYRWYDTKGIEPLFPFGHGLSYTTFEYRNLELSKSKFTSKDTVTVKFNLTNTGKMADAEVTQLYVRDIESKVLRPVKELKGFKKVYLEPAETKQVEIKLTKRDFSYWDPDKKDWYAEPGEFEILIGSSSKDIRLKGKVTLVEKN